MVYKSSRYEHELVLIAWASSLSSGNQLSREVTGPTKGRWNSSLGKRDVPNGES